MSLMHFIVYSDNVKHSTLLQLHGHGYLDHVGFWDLRRFEEFILDE